MTDGPWSNPWRTGVDGASKRPWFVWKPRDPAHPTGPKWMLCATNGNYRRFASQKAAERAADEQNKLDS